MKNSFLLRVIAAIVALVVLLSNASNPPNGRTGAPFDSTCAVSGCHSPSNPAFDGIVSISGLPSTIQPNTNYTISLTVQATMGSPTRAGFQLVAVQGNNLNAGDLQASGDAGTEISGGREYVEHRGSKVMSGGAATWTFTWISPATSNGDVVNFYFTGNLANGSGSNGDKIVWGSESIQFAGGTPLNVNITNVQNVSCNGGSNGSATAVPTGGIQPYSYQWSNGETTATANQLPAGVASVTVTDNGGATSSKTTNIGQPSAINASASVSGQVTCVAAANITATASGGAGNFTYAWPDGSTGNVFTATAPGQYIVTVTDAAGCTKTAAATVLGNTTPPAANATGGNISCGNPTVVISASSNVGNASFVWSGPNGFTSNLQNPAVNAPGTYTVTVTNPANGCTNSAEAIVSGSTTVPSAAATGGTITCSTPSVTLSASSNVGGALFAWSGPNNFNSNLQNPVVTSAGNYTVTITNPDNGCTATATASVLSNNTAPTVNAVTNGAITCNLLSVTIAGSTNANPANFSWTGPNGFSSNQAINSVSVAGNYTLVVTNPSNGCTASASTVVTADNQAPNLTTSSNGMLTCNQLSTEICANSTTQNVSFQWSGVPFNSNQACGNVTQPGNYTVVATAANGCTTSSTVSVAQNIAAPGASATGGTLTCTTTLLQLQGNSPTPGVTFSWTGPNAFLSTQQNVGVSTPGTYQLVVTAPNGCTSTATAVVSQNIDLPSANIAPPANLNCQQNTITLDATASSQGANFSYNWTSSTGNILSGANTLLPNVSSAGVYFLEITNTQNGCTAANSVTVVQSPAVDISLNVNNVSCFGGSDGSAFATGLGGAGGFSYLWSNGSTLQIITQQPAGTYSVTATDVEGCTKSATINIEQAAILMANAVATPETVAGANDGTASANPTGGTPDYLFVWNTGATTASIQNLPPGNYSVTLTDANGCTDVQTVTVNSFNCELSIAAASNNISCFGAADGSASVQILGANLPVSIVWKNSNGTVVGTQNTISGLASGTYTVEVTDAGNCSAAANISIIQPAQLAANATATPETALGANNGTATATPTGGTPPYQFLWSNGANTAQLNNLSPAIYTVTVTDANGCTASQTTTVAGFNCNLMVNIAAIQNARCHDSGDGAASAIAVGGTPPYQYLWSSGQTTSTATNLKAGNYTIVVTDAAGCVATSEATISAPDALTINLLSIQHVECLEDKTGSISVETAGGTPPYYIAWNGIPFGNTIQNLGVGTYSTTLTDSQGCTATFSEKIEAIDSIPPSLTCPADIVVCGMQQVDFSVSVTDNCNLPAGALLQTAGLPSGSLFEVGITQQIFTAKDALGNTAQCRFSVEVKPIFIVVIEKVKDATAGQADGCINISTSGGGNLVFEWTGPDGFTANTANLQNLKAGVYTLKITDENGCQTTLFVEVKSIIGTQDPILRAGIKIYPNPAHKQGQVLNFENKTSETLSLQIFDPRGSLLHQILVEGESVFQLDLWQNALPEGLYMARFVSQRGTILSRTFAVQ